MENKQTIHHAIVTVLDSVQPLENLDFYQTKKLDTLKEEVKNIEKILDFLRNMRERGQFLRNQSDKQMPYMKFVVGKIKKLLNFNVDFKYNYNKNEGHPNDRFIDLTSEFFEAYRISGNIFYEDYFGRFNYLEDKLQAEIETFEASLVKTQTFVGSFNLHMARKKALESAIDDFNKSLPYALKIHLTFGTTA